MAEQPRTRGEGFLRSFERGVDAATRNNITPYGYSVTITTAFALLQTSRSDVGALEIFAFAGGAILAFAVVGGFASGGFRQELEDEPSHVKVLGGAFALLSVGLALVVAFVVGILVGGLAAWPVSSFSTTVAYVVLVGLEMAGAEWVMERNG